MANPEHVEVVKQGAEIIDLWRRNHYGAQLDLAEADLRGADLGDAVLIGADLSNAYLYRANLIGANLIGANLSGAYLYFANLYFTNLYFANLGGTDLTKAHCWSTAFTAVDLSETKGLETIQHDGPSTIGIDTIFKSGGHIPEVFLRGCGVPEEWIGYIQGMARQPIQFYQCVISHSAQDELFCTRLYNDLQASGVRCWYFPRDARGGRGRDDEIDRPIRIYDKVMVVCSSHSLVSEPVQKEIKLGWEKERQTGKKVLFPLAIDDSVYKSDDQYATLLRATVIEDFRQWTNPAEYKESLDKLVKDLARDEPAPPSQE